MPDTLLGSYTFVPSNSHNNNKHGGVGLLYKNSLPLKVREDIAFNETIVVELQFGGKIIFPVLYRSPAHTNGTPEFERYYTNFITLRATIKDQDPYVMFFTGDFNGHSQLWWQGGDPTPEGISIEDLTTMLGLTQLTQLTNQHIWNQTKTPLALTFILTNPILYLKYGARTSLDLYCHHQITHCRFNFKKAPPPPFERRNWLYDRANVNHIDSYICFKIAPKVPFVVQITP